MSDKFYAATRVMLDGRLLKLLDGSEVDNLPFWRDPKIVDAIVDGAKNNVSNEEIGLGIGVSKSEVGRIKRIYRSRWEGFKGVSSVVSR